MVLDSFLDFVDEDGFETAAVGVVFAAVAVEVGVGVAVAAGGGLDDHAGSAASAHDGRLQPVVVEPGLFTALRGGEDGLDFEPGFGVDQRGVVAGVLDALEGDDASVLGVGED